MMYLTDLDKACRSSGLKVITLEGWKGRGRPGLFNPKGVVIHHTGTSKATTDNSVVRLLLNGRPDLSGPLSQIGLARDGTVYVIAAGRSNHAGKTKANKHFIAGDGNTQSVGIEAFNSGYEGWTTAQLNAYHKLSAALCDWYKWPRSAVYAHGETSTTGKWDPGVNGRVINMEQFRLKVKAIKLNNKENVNSDYGTMNPDSYRLRQKNDSTLWLKKRLDKHLKSLGRKHAMNLKSKKYGLATKRAMTAFQKAQGWKGSDADGMPGPTTLKRLKAAVKTPTKTPTPPSTPKSTPAYTLEHRHVSMQFSDSKKQQESDLRKIFTLTAPNIITGTEAGSGSQLGALIKKYAADNGYLHYVAPSGTDSWICIRKSIVKKVTKKSFEKVMDSGGRTAGANTNWSPKGLVRMEVELKAGGTLVVYALHGLIRSRTKNHSIRLGAKVSYQALNRKMVKRLEKRMIQDYKSGKIALFGGDFNQLFNAKKANRALFDTTLTSAWHLTKKFPNTGHGNIDGVGKLKRDSRITCTKARVWDDGDFYLNTDHFMVGATWRVKP